MTVVPTPRSWQRRGGDLLLGPVVAVFGGGDAAGVLAEHLRRSAGVRFRDVAVPSEADVSFAIDETLGAEAYRLDIDERVNIVSGDSRGAGWAVQTLLQLLPPEVYGPGPMEPAHLRLPRTMIEDAPRYSWRGSMLDVARHFLPMEYVLKHLDTMAMHKLNVLHLHLTDDQGWRLPVASFPLLTEVGGWRPGTLPGHQPPPDENDCDDVAHHDGRPHGGSYTVAEIRTLVAKANRLGITVVPEIDMPGHMEAAIAAYPWLGACDHVSHPRTCWGVSEHVLQLSRRTVDFCTTVLGEAMDLFPGSPLHVGGDECPDREWLTDPISRATMASIGATTGKAAQAWFENLICQHVLDAGRMVIAWDEVLDGGAPEGTTIMVWREAQAIARAVALGHDVIAAPAEFTYLDQHQGTPGHPLSIGGPLTVQKVGQLHTVFDVPAGSRVLGGQFQLWSEYIRSPSRAEFFTWPRGASVAQQLWAGTPGGLDSLEGFGPHLARLTSADINWCRSHPATTSSSTRGASDAHDH